VRESNIGNELKDVAQEVMRFGERCVQAGRTWLNERRDEMNNRNNDGREDYGQQRPGQRSQRQGPQASGSRQAGQYGSEYSDQNRFEQASYDQAQGMRGARGQQGTRSRGEYYGGAQFGERMQSQGWDDDGGSEWSYEGGPERFSSSGYSEGNLRASGAYQGDLSQTQRQNVQQYGRQGYGQAYGHENYGVQRGRMGREQSGFGASSDYYSGREGYRAQGAFGSEYNTYGRNQGFGEGSNQPRQNQGMRGESGAYHPGLGGQYYAGESTGGRGPLYGAQDYLDEGEMSGYRGRRELSTQEPGSRSSGRYGTEPGQYGYGGYGLSGRGFRGVGPKNYTRSDERLTEEINERLTDDDDLDASEITVRVVDCKVTLEGTVDQRWMKHRAEDIADSCNGVREVDNRITVASAASELGASSRTAKAGSSRTGTGTTGTTGTTGAEKGAGSTGTH
jgi:hypothetical protein